MEPALDALRALLRSPHVVDGVFAILLVEAVAVAVLGRRRPGWSVLDVAAQLGAGGFLLLALRAALAQADPLWIGVCLACAFPANLWDLKRRWRPAR